MPDPAAMAPVPDAPDRPAPLPVRVLRFLRFSHTVFALPFALGAMFVAGDGWPGVRVFLLILAAMVFARSAAMAFNRVADWEIDKRNPRTADRHRLLSRPAGVGIVVVSAVLFVITAGLINPLCLALSPVALFLVLVYSLAKRFTDWSHFLLGLALGVSPVGAWIAVTGRIDPVPGILALAVLLWVAGFDLIYALQDRAFDIEAGLHSLAARLDPRASRRLAMALHALAVAALAWFGIAAALGPWYFAGLAVIGLVLTLEHARLDPDNEASLQRAFFRDNAIVGLVFLSACLADTLAA